MKIEFTDEELLKIEDVSKATLAALFMIGIVSASVVMPNIVRLLGPLYLRRARNQGKNNLPRKLIQYTRAKKAIYYLSNRKMIAMEGRGPDKVIKLTNKGKAWLSRMVLQKVDTDIKRKWNKRWWLIASDIPTKTHRKAAERLRSKFRSMGFYSMQKSLWIYPFDPTIEIQKICEYYNVLKFVTVMEIYRLDKSDKEKLMKFFFYLNK